MDIRGLVEKIRKKYGTSNPYQIAKDMKILLLYENLGSINGYYNMVYRQKQIHINQSLDEHLKLLTVAHELGHAIMHPKANTPFLINNTFISVDKMEIEASKFAMELIVSEEDLAEYEECTIDQLSFIFGYDKELINLRLSKLKFI